MARHDNCEIGHPVTDAYDKDQLERAAAPSITSKISEDEIDRNLIGTFPASDPPSWTLGVSANGNRPATVRKIRNCCRVNRRGSVRFERKTIPNSCATLTVLPFDEA